MQEIDINSTLIIMATPFVIIVLWQISSYLNMTILPTGMVTMEIADFCKLTDFSENDIRVSEDKQKMEFRFSIVDEKFEETSYAIFDSYSLKLKETSDFEIDFNKIQTLRLEKFAKLIGAKKEFITISEDGNTFSQTDKNNNIIGSVTFDEEFEPKEVTGKFKKYFYEP